MKSILAFCAAGTALALSTASAAATTGPAGGGQPFENQQPYLALSQLITLQGIYPQHDPTQNESQGAYQTLAMMRTFGGNYAIGGTALANGQTLSIAQNTAMFSLVGTYYGGNGQTTFALPDLRGRTIIGTGRGNGLSQRVIGEQDGSAYSTLSIAQMPAHSHGIDVPPGQTGVTGGSQPFGNMQPSLAMTYMIATGGDYLFGNAFIGEVSAFGGNFAPTGWLQADGRTVSIADFPTLYGLIGTTYGGNGVTTFALPDLRGRTVVGANNSLPLGTAFGSESHTLTLAEMPTHDHDGGAIQVDPAGGNQPFDNRQPSLALNYYVSLQGIYPSRDDNYVGDEPYLGEIVASASNQAPNGYALAAGQLLPIQQYEALFSIFGTTYGGNGQTTFALPDLRGRTIAGWGNSPYGTYNIGEMGGISFETLNASQLPVHVHSLPDVAPGVPEPATWAMLLMGFGLTGAVIRRRRVAFA